MAKGFSEDLPDLPAYCKVWPLWKHSCYDHSSESPLGHSIPLYTPTIANQACHRLTPPCEILERLKHTLLGCFVGLILNQCDRSHKQIHSHGVRVLLSPSTECGDERLCVARVCYYGMGVGWDWDWDGDPWEGLPVWPEMAIPTLKHKGLGYVGDPTSGARP